MPTIGLCMIVRDEAKVITRCLDSVRTLVDYVLVEDTGSTDGTQQVVSDWLVREQMAGEVIEEPWQDFAYNRNHALAKMREVKAIDYVIMIDADDVVVFEPGFDVAAFKADLQHDVLEVHVRKGELRWVRPHIGSNRAALSVKGVLHECLEDKVPLSIAEAKGLYIQSGHEGARSSNVQKYQDDATLLEQTIKAETDPYLLARYRFYLAQSYRDAGDWEKAREHYLIRAGLGGWAEEVFCSLYEAAKLDEALDAPADQVIAAYNRAAAAGPTRAEAHYGAARYGVMHGRFEEAYQIAKLAIGRRPPPDALFVQADVYDYRLLGALAVAAFETGRPAECVAAYDRLLSEGKLPAVERDQVANNRALAVEALRQSAGARPGGSDPFLGLLEIAQAKEAVKDAAPNVIAAYAAASAAAPHRAEALHAAARFCRNEGRYDEGYAYAFDGLAIPRPQDGPGVETWVYDYGLLDELMANAFWAGRYVECAQACDRLLRENLMPAEMAERIARNREVLDAKLRDRLSAA